MMNVEKDVVEDIEKRYLVWFGHVNRMVDVRVPTKTITWVPPDGKRRGRPRQS